MTKSDELFSIAVPTKKIRDNTSLEKEEIQHVVLIWRCILSELHHILSEAVFVSDVYCSSELFSPYTVSSFWNWKLLQVGFFKLN